MEGPQHRGRYAADEPAQEDATVARSPPGKVARTAQLGSVQRRPASRGVGVPGKLTRAAQLQRHPGPGRRAVGPRPGITHQVAINDGPVSCALDYRPRWERCELR